jgi:ribosomal protein L34E
MGAGRPFQKGQSGNPGGRTKAYREVRKLAGEKSPRAVEILDGIMKDVTVEPRARIEAARVMLAYGAGLPEKFVHKVVEHVKRTPRDYTMDELLRIAQSTEDGAGEAH